MDETKIGFWTGANYLKRETTSSGSQSYSVAAFGDTTINIDHNLGHIPGDWHVGVDISGTIWSNNQPWKGMDGAGGTQTVINWQTWSDENTLSIYIYNPTGSTKTGTIYYTIYMDYDV